MSWAGHPVPQQKTAVLGQTPCLIFQTHHKQWHLPYRPPGPVPPCQGVVGHCAAGWAGQYSGPSQHNHWFAFLARKTLFWGRPFTEPTFWGGRREQWRYFSTVTHTPWHPLMPCPFFSPGPRRASCHQKASLPQALLGPPGCSTAPMEPELAWLSSPSSPLQLGPAVLLGS